jgi:hypothetical protein
MYFYLHQIIDSETQLLLHHTANTKMYFWDKITLSKMSLYFDKTVDCDTALGVNVSKVTVIATDNTPM